MIKEPYNLKKHEETLLIVDWHFSLTILFLLAYYYYYYICVVVKFRVLNYKTEVILNNYKRELKDKTFFVLLRGASQKSEARKSLLSFLFYPFKIVVLFFLKIDWKFIYGSSIKKSVYIF